MEKILYSTEWASDPVVAGAILNLLTDELTNRGVEYKLTYTKGETAGLDFNVKGVEIEKGESDVYKCVVVNEKILEKANAILDFVHQKRTKELKEQALEIAKRDGYIRTDEEIEEYSRDLNQAYGW